MGQVQPGSLALGAVQNERKGGGERERERGVRQLDSLTVCALREQELCEYSRGGTGEESGMLGFRNQRRRKYQGASSQMCLTEQRLQGKLRGGSGVEKRPLDLITVHGCPFREGSPADWHHLTWQLGT